MMQIEHDFSLQAGIEPETLRTRGQCINHWATLLYSLFVTEAWFLDTWSGCQSDFVKMFEVMLRVKMSFELKFYSPVKRIKIMKSIRLSIWICWHVKSNAIR